MSVAINFVRRAWRCKRCGKTMFLIGGFRGDQVAAPVCFHTGTVYNHEPAREMRRAVYRGQPGGKPHGGRGHE